ncbi:MAG TPA: TIGR03435 family protein [Acidobacteriaceae bacterium]|nr:TIGR03435 family protein [Acidobacteriaceae bacterium]
MPSRAQSTLFRAFAFCLAALIPISAAHAQLIHKGPQGAIALSRTLAPYDVSVIKRNNQNSPTEESGSISVHDNILIASNVTLKLILQVVYDIKGDLITGLAGPLASQSFDVTAKVLPRPDGTQAKLTDSQLLAMMIPVLADRFHLQVHTEPKIAPVYDLVVAKSGIKFKLDQSERKGSGWGIDGENTQRVLNAKNSSLADLAAALSDITDRKVIDKTNLTGHADITLKWADDVALTQADPNAISIFTAVEEQLGLKLQPSKGPVDTLVIDHVEMPTEN